MATTLKYLDLLKATKLNQEEEFSFEVMEFQKPPEQGKTYEDYVKLVARAHAKTLLELALLRIEDTINQYHSLSVFFKNYNFHHIGIYSLETKSEIQDPNIKSNALSSMLEDAYLFDNNHLLDNLSEGFFSEIFKKIFENTLNELLGITCNTSKNNSHLEFILTL